MDARVTTMALAPTSDIASVTRAALQQALVGDTRLPDEVLSLPGMSSRKYRMFVNALVAALPSPRYFEIGSWAGSTLCSAIHGNDVTATAIDNWSLFGGPSDTFFANLARYKGAARVSFLERDFRDVAYASLGPFNVYLFDGPHSYEDHYDGMVLPQPALDRQYVQIIDDWNWEHVRRATMRAIADLGLQIDFLAEIRTTLDDQHAPEPHGMASDWHNGYCIAVLTKP